MVYLNPNSGQWQWHMVGFNLLEKCNWEETVPNQGLLIYLEPHMTFSTNWCELLCNLTSSWLPLTHYLSFSLSVSLLLNPSPLSMLSSSTLPLVLTHTLALIDSPPIKMGLNIFLYELSLICSEWIIYYVAHGVTENVFSMNIVQHFSDFHKLQIILLQSSPSTVTEDFITGPVLQAMLWEWNSRGAESFKCNI